MSFLTIVYFIFLFLGLGAYYLMPEKLRWVVLLVMSYIYYLSFGVSGVFYLLFTTITVYVLGRVLEMVQSEASAYLTQNKSSLTREEKKSYKDKIKRRKRLSVVAAVVLNFGMLSIVKYRGSVSVIGISFFTFQAISYVIDVYQGRYPSEKNPFKFALFVSFFPQIMQGPIGRYDKLAPQLFRGNRYSLSNIQFGLQRIGWGLFKKLLIADRAGQFVHYVFANQYGANGALSIAGILMYSIQLYMDFSGGIDIVIGTAEMFGIQMSENFRQPYFSKSIGEFWRRWHITLGTWMKDYIFYPFSLSKGVNKMTKWGKKHLGNHLGRTLPICMANLLIFFIVGIWHGTEMRYIAYGMYNGMIIAVSNLLEPLYKKGLERFHINNEARGWKIFQIFRTFLLVNLGWVFDCSCAGLNAGLHTFKVIFTNLDFSQFNHELFVQIGLTAMDYIIIVICCVVILLVSIIKEKGIQIRKCLSEKPLPLRWMVYYGVFIAILVFSFVTNDGGFMYAVF